MMKFNLSPSMLLAALSALAFTSALSSGLENRQGQIIDTAPTVTDCANGPDCKLAATYWNDCQGAHVLGMPSDPSSNVRSCLCPPGRAVPSHIDWYSKFRNCIICVEMAAGTPRHDLPMYIEVEKVAGSAHNSVGYCHGTLSTEQFVDQMKSLVKEKEFPLELPEAVLKSAGGKGGVERAVTPITLAVPMHTTTPFSAPTAPAHSGFSETALTAVPNSLFSTFPAVPMSSVLASISAASFLSSIPTAVPNSLFSTFPAVPMSSVLASISAASSSAPTAVPNSLFSTFPAVPMSSVLASISAASSLTPTAVPNSLFSTFPAVPMSSVLASISSAMMTTKTSASQVSSRSTSTPVLNCSHDNCFRGALRSAPAVMSFCSTYTQNPVTAGTGFPSCLLPCNNSPVSISSACSCLASHSSSISSAISMPTFTSKASDNSEDSATTTSLSSPSVYPTANPAKWISLPASEAVKLCAASKSCVNAHIYHDTCLKENDEGVWKCLCKKWPIAWKYNLNQCTQCLENTLPRFASNVESLTTVVEQGRAAFCAYTGSKDGAKDALVTTGKIITEKYQSSAVLFNMTLIDAIPKN
ncbi:hypothetical protein ONS96_007428 [Cadophora gregata f. sp. sojae]|nr:hypothetical protein ONS96_007428 [Cadophora gregata f. sp. sojae]